MCSSPKSQSTIKIAKVATSSMSQGQWSQFAAVANAAEARRQKRKAAEQLKRQEKAINAEKEGYKTSQISLLSRLQLLFSPSKRFSKTLTR